MSCALQKTFQAVQKLLAAKRSRAKRSGALRKRWISAAPCTKAVLQRCPWVLRFCATFLCFWRVLKCLPSLSSALLHWGVLLQSFEVFLASKAVQNAAKQRLEGCLALTLGAQNSSIMVFLSVWECFFFFLMCFSVLRTAETEQSASEHIKAEKKQ